METTSEEIETLINEVACRIETALDSLNNIKKFIGHGIGFEGWFKIEVITALGDNVGPPKNKGADLDVQINGKRCKVELRCKNEFEMSWIERGLKDHPDADMCLFLTRMPEPEKLNKLDKWKTSLNLKKLELIGKKVTEDKMWMVGILKKSIADTPISKSDNLQI